MVHGLWQLWDGRDLVLRKQLAGDPGTPEPQSTSVQYTDGPNESEKTGLLRGNHGRSGSVERCWYNRTAAPRPDDTCQSKYAAISTTDDRRQTTDDSPQGARAVVVPFTWAHFKGVVSVARHHANCRAQQITAAKNAPCSQGKESSIFGRLRDAKVGVL